MTTISSTKRSVASPAMSSSRISRTIAPMVDASLRAGRHTEIV